MGRESAHRYLHSTAQTQNNRRQTIHASSEIMTHDPSVWEAKTVRG
jgi:hypothetical protein